MKQKILVACEESQAVVNRLRAIGHEAYSCDILECTGGHPEYHIQQDVLPLLNGNCTFSTADGITHEIVGKWDAIIAFPPCTHLAVSGAKHFEGKRKDGRQREAIIFFGEILKADCEKIMVENPVNIISGEYIQEYFPDLCRQYGFPLKPSQQIQPYEFGSPARKKTNLWLKNLPHLKPTNIVEPKLVSYQCADGRTVTFSEDYGGGGGKNGQRRSKTYPGVADAIVNQWFKECD